MLFSITAVGQTIRVGAKHFTEGYILSEIIAQQLEAKGFSVKRVYNLGGTLVCFEALKNNEIDVYPEYTGTITKEILKSENINDIGNYNLGISKPYGFNNTYALVVTNETAALHSLKKISDLQKSPNLKAGISYEFLKRQDGWDRLAEAYSLQQKPTGLEHGLAYEALLNSRIDLTDCYSTDAEIAKHKLVVLEDDKNFFPRYDAVSLYRNEIRNVMNNVVISISEKEMREMNSLAVNNNIPFDQIARKFLSKSEEVPARPFNLHDLASKTLTHLYLTFTALILAIVVAVPLGIQLYRTPKAANVFLYIAGLMQTIPSIALLAIMIPLFGIGSLPAIVALFLYAILPILRNTVNGLRNVDPLLKEISASLGMSNWQSLRYVEGPLALPAILTGIRIAAVINVGTATLAAFIGAGGLGEYIVTGLALNNTSMILMGAIPAAILALVIEFIFEAIERRAFPAHLRKN